MSRLTVSQLKLKLDLPAECSHPRTDSEGQQPADRWLKSEGHFISKRIPWWREITVNLPPMQPAVQLKSDETAGGSCSGL